MIHFFFSRQISVLMRRCCTLRLVVVSGEWPCSSCSSLGDKTPCSWSTNTDTHLPEWHRAEDTHSYNTCSQSERVRTHTHTHSLLVQSQSMLSQYTHTRSTHAHSLSSQEWFSLSVRVVLVEWFCIITEALSHLGEWFSISYWGTESFSWMIQYRLLMHRVV